MFNSENVVMVCASIIITIFIMVIIIPGNEIPDYENNMDFDDVKVNVDMKNSIRVNEIIIEFTFYDSAAFDIEYGVNETERLYFTHHNLEQVISPSSHGNSLEIDIDYIPGEYYITITNQNLNITETQYFVLEEIE